MRIAEMAKVVAFALEQVQKRPRTLRMVAQFVGEEWQEVMRLFEPRSSTPFPG